MVTMSCLRCVVVIVIDVGVASKREIRTGELRRLQKWYLPLPLEAKLLAQQNSLDAKLLAQQNSLVAKLLAQQNSLDAKLLALQNSLDAKLLALQNSLEVCKDSLCASIGLVGISWEVCSF